ncbi:MAG: hypothetical protein ACD_39C00859G0001 [uncultured bacterium]|nr:MAG: hypothetical protein ACD_39C00859G0001 [uncultured bacterium]
MTSIFLLTSSAGISSISTTFSCGIAKISPLVERMSEGIMARVRGSLIRKEEPLPSSEMISTLPPRLSMLALTTSMPTPRPESSETCSAVDRPGRKTRFCFSLADKPRAFSTDSMPRSMAFAQTFSPSMPRPSSLTSMITRLAS